MSNIGDLRQRLTQGSLAYRLCSRVENEPEEEWPAAIRAEISALLEEGGELNGEDQQPNN